MCTIYKYNFYHSTGMGFSSNSKKCIVNSSKSYKHTNTKETPTHPPIYIYTRTYTHTLARMHTHTHTHLHTRAHARTHARTHARVDGKEWEGIIIIIIIIKLYCHIQRVRDGKGWPPNIQSISGRRRCDFPVLQL